MIEFVLNDESIKTDQPAGLTVLDFVRYRKELKGTKIGCREGDCGACTVLVGTLANGEVEYRTMTSCLMPLANAAGKHIVTVEGINRGDGGLTPVQEALVDAGGTQCGFCTVGFVMSMTGFCIDRTEKSREMAVSAVDGNICRCTGYKSIEKACERISVESELASAVDRKIVPAYFERIASMLESIQESGGVAFQPAGSNELVGGGTDLYVQKHDEIVDADVSYIFDDSDLRFISLENGFVEIGPSTVVTDLLESTLFNDIFPGLFEHLKLVSSTPIRNMATLAGNFVNASPIGDMTVWFLALDASVVFSGGHELPMRELYLDYKKLAMRKGESISKIRFRKPVENWFFNFEKVCKRKYLDIATVNTAISLTVQNGVITDAHLAAGGVAPVPLYLKETSMFLRNRSLDRDLIGRACILIDAEVHPISDVRGSKEYKRLLLKQLFKAHFVELFDLDFS